MRALQTWQAASGITGGPLWRVITKCGTVRPGRTTSRAAPDLIKFLAERAGMHPDRISPYSLRAEHVTEAKRRDAPDLAVVSQTHHARAGASSATCAERPVPAHLNKFLGL